MTINYFVRLETNIGNPDDFLFDVGYEGDLYCLKTKQHHRLIREFIEWWLSERPGIATYSMSKIFEIPSSVTFDKLIVQNNFDGCEDIPCGLTYSFDRDSIQHKHRIFEQEDRDD